MIINLFSKRQKELRGEVPDVYTYDTIPQPLRVQIVHIWRDALGNEDKYCDLYANGHRETHFAYRFIVNALCREYGLFILPPANSVHGSRNYLQELADFLLAEKDSERVLDAIDISFKFIDKVTRRKGRDAADAAEACP